MNAISRARWQFQIAGCFWMLYGLAGCGYYSAENWRDVLNGRVVFLLPLFFCVLLVVSGYGLLKQRRWSKGLSGLLLVLGILFLLDMLAMSAYVGNYNVLFLVGCVGVLAGIYTLILVVFVKMEQSSTARR